MDLENYNEGKSMQRPHLFEANCLVYWKNRFETYVKSKDIDLWYIIVYGNYKPTIKDKDEEFKDLSTLPLDEIIDNLKVSEVVLEKDLETSRNKKEKYKSLALKARKVLSEEEATSSDNNDEEYAMAVRDFKKFLRIRGKFVSQPHDDKRNFWKAKEEKKVKDDQRCFNEDDSKKEEICLMALDDNEHVEEGLGRGGRNRIQEFDGLMLVAKGEECLDGWVRASEGEVKGSVVDYGVTKSLIGEIPGENTRESGGEEFRVDGGIIDSRWVRDTVSSPKSAPTFAESFEINDLKAQIQEKDIVILKLREKLNSLSGDVKVRKVKREVGEIETLNLELDHKVTKLAAENEHLKQTYKQLFDSIKSSRVQSKEHYDDLINKVNLKSVEVSDLNASLQEKVLTYKQLFDSIKSSRVQLKEHYDDLINKVNLKSVEVSYLNASLQEKVLVITALKEQLNKLKGKAVLTEAVSLNPIDPALLQVDVASLVPKLRKSRTAHTDYIRHTQEEAATLREIIERVTLVFSASGSMSQDNTKKNRIRQTQKKAKKTELEDHLRTVKSSLNKASVVDSKATSSVIKSVSNVNSNLKCASCKIIMMHVL
uniref:Zf-CCHC domain-containing protein/UBN2 domain-containing protein n=1 Tax=Tanacetum cinerariifolium TaxID=118510 RepID=A0A6L2JP77_TANCI|nr:zf-CCHC domain-containing protein/UBN2 domain-containing protein [Tanacetum cinerariifolium]